MAFPIPGASRGTWASDLINTLLAEHDSDGLHSFGGGFVDRGDPAAVDASLGAGLTEDGAWHELDLGPDGLNVVPAGAKAILLRAAYQANAVGETMRLRKFGNSNNINTTAVTSQVNGVTIVLDAVVSCDAGSSIEYILSSPQTTAASITVKGWWL